MNVETFRQEIAALAGLSHQLGDEYVYRNPLDFVAREGRWYEPATTPPYYRKGAPRMCFGNSIIGAVVYGLAYVEGYALSPYSGPVHHAWNATAGGIVVDLTWGAWDRVTERQVAQIGIAYLGVEFSPERADDATWNGDASVLDDNERGWPILREPWLGEPAIEWPPSPRIAELLIARAHMTERRRTA